MRVGMTNLVKRLRRLTEAGTADYSVAGVTYWPDDELQAILDQHREQLTMITLTQRPDYINAAYTYLTFAVPGEMNIEAPTDGTTHFKVQDSAGAIIGTANYAYNEDTHEVVFTATQGGSARFLSGYVYNLVSAASDVWLTKAAHAYTAINFSADGARFDREAIHAHCMSMAVHFSGARKMNSTSRLVRTDLAGPGDGDRF